MILKALVLTVRIIIEMKESFRYEESFRFSLLEGFLKYNLASKILSDYNFQASETG